MVSKLNYNLEDNSEGVQNYQFCYLSTEQLKMAEFDEHVPSKYEAMKHDLNICDFVDDHINHKTENLNFSDEDTDTGNFPKFT